MAVAGDFVGALTNEGLKITKKNGTEVSGSGASSSGTILKGAKMFDSSNAFFALVSGQKMDLIVTNDGKWTKVMTYDLPYGTTDLMIEGNKDSATVVFSTPEGGVKFQIGLFIKGWGDDWYQKDINSAWYQNGHNFFAGANVNGTTVVIKGQKGSGKASILSVGSQWNSLQTKRHEEFSFQGGNPEKASCSATGGNNMTCIFYQQDGSSKIVQYTLSGNYGSESNPVTETKLLGSSDAISGFQVQEVHCSGSRFAVGLKNPSGSATAANWTGCNYAIVVYNSSAKVQKVLSCTDLKTTTGQASFALDDFSENTVFVSYPPNNECSASGLAVN